MMRLFLLTACFLVTAIPLLAGVDGQLRQGGKQYKAKKYGSALNTYNNILQKNPHDQRALFNAGNAHYRLQEYTQAQESYKQAAEQTGDYTQSAVYNLANAYYQAGNKEKAIESYKAAIVQNPQDKEAIHNLQLILQQQQNQNKDNQQNDQNQDNQSDQQNQDQQNNQGQAPQDQPKQQSNGQMDQKDADRVMAMAKEQEYHKAPQSSRANNQTVDKDW